jgi:hypothetical protein
VPAIGGFDQLPGLAAAIVGLPVDVENKIEIDDRDGAVRMHDEVAVFRIETFGCC